MELTGRFRLICLSCHSSCAIFGTLSSFVQGGLITGQTFECVAKVIFREWKGIEQAVTKIVRP